MSGANLTVWIALAAFPPAVIMGIRSAGARRGVVYSLLGGWLFLPHYENVVRISIIPSKTVYISAVLLAAVVLLDSGFARRFRFRIADVPLAVVCVSPFFTSTLNGLGLYDGAAAAFQSAMVWGVPYLLGRVYIRDLEGLRELSVAVVIAALMYAPLCLWEIRFSPQLNRVVYGFITQEFSQAVRFGGFRPIVFMRHGLMVSLFMASGAVAAYWLSRVGAPRLLVGRLPMRAAAVILMVTAVACKSTGALVLLVGAVGIIEISARTRSAVFLISLIALPPVYVSARCLGWRADQIVQVAAEWVGEERAASLRFRFDNEDVLKRKAFERPWFGWGGWGRSRVYDEDGRDVSITDSFWITALGGSGFVLLGALGLAVSLPVVLFLRRIPPSQWHKAAAGGAVVTVMVNLMWVVDSVVNSMTMPLYLFATGGLLSGMLRRSNARPPARDSRVYMGRA